MSQISINQMALKIGATRQIDTNFNVESEISHAFSIQSKSEHVSIALSFIFQAIDFQKELLPLELQIGIDTIFHVNGLANYLNFKSKPEATSINKSLAEIIFSMAYATSRGIIFEKSIGTPFAGLIIPTVDTDDILNS